MKKHLYPLKGYNNVFVAMDGAIDVVETDGQKWGNLMVYEIRDSRTNSGCPLQTLKMGYQSFRMEDDQLHAKIDLASPTEVTLPAVQEY